MSKMKNKIKKGCQLLVESILKEELIDANDILKNLVALIEEQRENEITNLVLEQDEGGDDAAAEEDEGGDDAAAEEDEGGDEGGDDEVSEDEDPEGGDTSLGENLGDAQDGEDEEGEDAENMVGNAKLTELGNDEIELNCQINEKMISLYSDRLANLKTALNALGLEKEEREYITLEMQISYYSKKLRDLQDKCEITVDQNEVKERLDIIEKAIKTLEAQINEKGGGADDVKSTEELESEGDDEGEDDTEVEEDEGEEETEEQ